MSKKKALEKVKDDFEAVVETIDLKFGDKYSAKNPGLVQHLLNTIQQEEDREITRQCNGI